MPSAPTPDPDPDPDEAEHEERLELARSAWLILKSAGGVIDRASLAAELGVSRQRAYQLAKQTGFPDPIKTRMQARELWLTAEVHAYRNRPRTTTARAPQAAPDGSDPVAVARAAWRILNTAGGLIDRPAIAQELGITRSAVHVLTASRAFPEPAGHAGDVAYWLTAELEQHQRSTRRR